MLQEGLTPDELATLAKMIRAGVSQKQMASHLKRSTSTIRKYVTRIMKVNKADASVPQIPTHVYDASQQILLLDRCITKAECVLAAIKDEDVVNFRIFCDAVNTLVNARAMIEGRAPSSGNEKPFKMTIKVAGASDVEIDAAMNGDDDIPELTEGEIVDSEPDFETDAGEPLAKEYDPLKGF